MAKKQAIAWDTSYGQEAVGYGFNVLIWFLAVLLIYVFLQGIFWEGISYISWLFGFLLWLVFNI